MPATRSQIIRSPSTGMTRRTFRGHEWCVIVQQDEDAKAEMLTFATEEKAQRTCRAVGERFAPMVHYVERGLLSSPS